MTGRILTREPPRLLEFSWDTGDTIRPPAPAAEATRIVSIPGRDRMDRGRAICYPGRHVPDR